MSAFVYLVHGDPQAVRAAVALLEADGHSVERVGVATGDSALLKVVTGQDRATVEGVLTAMAPNTTLLKRS